MKSILGLDLGTTSIGWALVKEAENESEKSEIVKLGVRLVPLTVDERTDFEKGKSITTNADRRLKRGMRRNLQRYKLRREALIEELKRSIGSRTDSVSRKRAQVLLFVLLKLGLNLRLKKFLFRN